MLTFLADLIWIDHVTTDLISRQHIVLGNSASGRVTISNCEINGATAWSAKCNGEHYWNMYFTGSADSVTLKGNYIHHTSGRAPKVAGKTLLHAVNNYFSTSSVHDFEGDAGAQIVAEGNVFENVKEAMQSGLDGKWFASEDANSNAQCKQYLGHVCELNSYESSGALTGSDTSVLSGFKGQNVASANTAADTKDVVNTAGYGKI